MSSSISWPDQDLLEGPDLTNLGTPQYPIVCLAWNRQTLGNFYSYIESYNYRVNYRYLSIYCEQSGATLLKYSHGSSHRASSVGYWCAPLCR